MASPEPIPVLPYREGLHLSRRQRFWRYFQWVLLGFGWLVVFAVLLFQFVLAPRVRATQQRMMQQQLLLSQPPGAPTPAFILPAAPQPVPDTQPAQP